MGALSVTIDQAGQVYGAGFAVSLNQSHQSLNAGLVLRDPQTQQVYVQTRDAAGQTRATLLGKLDGPSWRVAGAGHWDADGVRGLVLHDPRTGRLKVWYLSGARPQVSAAAGWDVAAVYDRDRNGTTDLYLQSERTGEVVVWAMNGRELLRTDALPLGDVPGDLEGVADLDGDGELLWEDDGVLRATRQGVKTEVGRLPAGWVMAEVSDLAGTAAEVLLQDTHSGPL
jgi:hypothetical protein